MTKDEAKRINDLLSRAKEREDWLFALFEEIFGSDIQETTDLMFRVARRGDQNTQSLITEAILQSWRAGAPLPDAFAERLAAHLSESNVNNDRLRQALFPGQSKLLGPNILRDMIIWFAVIHLKMNTNLPLRDKRGGDGIFKIVAREYVDLLLDSENKEELVAYIYRNFRKKRDALGFPEQVEKTLKRLGVER